MSVTRIPGGTPKHSKRDKSGLAFLGRVVEKTKDYGTLITDVWADPDTGGGPNGPLIVYDNGNDVPRSYYLASVRTFGYPVADAIATMVEEHYANPAKG